MSTGILGVGWVTPLGRDISSTWAALKSGAQAEPAILEGAENWPVLKAPAGVLADVESLPRLRRSSLISHLAVAAARDAATMAGLTAEQLANCLLIFAVSDGGVIYTRRFDAGLIEKGLGAGSPLLFPETVYNAPASHIAAALGMAGEVITLVGDSAAALSALHTGAELIAAGATEHCLVVSAQEADWISAEAYGRWKLIRGAGEQDSATFSEGAAAILLGREAGRSLIGYSHPGLSYGTEEEAAARMRKILTAIPADLRPDLIVSSASGIDFDWVEEHACREVFPNTPVTKPKTSLGDALAVSALQQVIVADLTLAESKNAHALVPAAGFNGQLGALLLTRRSG